MRIAIIGGSSQVGSSIALYLNHFKQAEVVCFIRGSYSSVFFELFNIPYDKIDLNNKEQLRSKLNDFDAVIDCSYPAGQLFDIVPSIKKNFEAIISAMPQNAVFIYMSSIMAYGMPMEIDHVENYKIPRTSYAYIKRKAEQEATRLCKQYAVKSYNFRLSQVHGFLQSVNGSFREKLSSASQVYIKGNPEELTNTVFISSVCQAIVKCIKGEVKPGLYTLVSEPQWTLQELYGYYQTNYRIDCKQEYFQPEKASTTPRSLISSGIKILKKYRPLLETYVLMRVPATAITFKGRYRQSEVMRMVNEKATKESIDYNLLGKPSLATIRNINSSIDEISTCEKEIETFYNKVIAENRK